MMSEAVEDTRALPVERHVLPDGRRFYAWASGPSLTALSDLDRRMDRRGEPALLLPWREIEQRLDALADLEARGLVTTVQVGEFYVVGITPGGDLALQVRG